MTATCWSHMEVGPHRGTRGGKGPRARLHNTLQQIVVDEYKRQNRRFRWVRFADASKQQVEALFSWRESLDSWHLWNFDQEAFDVIQAADNAYQQRLALVETTGVVLPQGAPSQDQAAASGAAGASSSAADWLRPPTPPSASSWLQDSRTPLPRIRPSAEERQAAKSTLRGVYAKAAETRRESGQHKDRGPHRHEGRGLHQHHRDEHQLLLPLWNKGLIVLNPRLRGGKAIQDFPSHSAHRFGSTE